MGIYDRDYTRADRGGPSLWGQMRLWSMTTWLIAINVAVFVVQVLFGRAVSDWGAFSPQSAVYHLQIWRFITFQFLHAGIGHIFFNMLALYYFGPMIENYLGPRRYLAFYLLCGVSGAAMFLALMFAGLLQVSPTTMLIGASAGILGVLAAAATVAPDRPIMLIFPPVSLSLRVLAWIFIGIAVLTVLQNGLNAGGEAAHLGGAAMGFALIRKPSLLNVFDFNRPRKKRRRGGWRMDDWR
jgi:membrane associated rhomboid family serine protease